MKKCPYCGRDNEDAALTCHECGTEFVDAQAQAAREVLDIDSNVSPEEEPTPAEPVSADQQRSGNLPTESWLLFAIALSASGYFYVALSVVVLYLLFKRLQPGADWELLMVASGFTGTCIFRILYVLSANTGPIHLLEPALVILAAVILLFRQHRTLATLLLAYSAIGMVGELLSVVLQVKNISPEYAIFRALLSGLSIWLIRHWLKRDLQPKAPAATPTPSPVSANN